MARRLPLAYDPYDASMREAGAASASIQAAWTEVAAAANEPQKDRRNNWKIAALSAIAALVVGGVGAGSSIWTTHVQVSGQRQDFIRGQEQAAYSKCILDSSAANDALQIFRSSGSSSDFADVTSALKTLALDIDAIRVVGTETAYNDAVAMQADLDAMQSDTLVRQGNRLEGDDLALSNDTTKFIEASRRDVRG